MILGGQTRSSFIRASEISHAADARSIEQAYAAADGEDPIEEAEEVPTSPPAS